MIEIDLRNLPPGIKLKLNKNFKNYIFSSAVKKAGNIRKLSQQINVAWNTIHFPWRKNQKFVTFEVLKKLIDYLKIQEDIIGYIENWNKIKSNCRNLPLPKDEDLPNSFKEIDNYIRYCPAIKTLIHWYNLPTFRKIKIEFESQKEIFSQLLNKFSREYLEKFIKKSLSQLKDYTKRSRNITIRTLKNALKILGLLLDSISPRIIEISGIKNPKLPFNLSTPEGAEVRMAFLSDGHNPLNPKKNLKYQAGEIESHKRIIKLCKDLFGEFSLRTEKEGKNKYQSYFPCVIGDILELSGVIRGSKIKKNPYLPKDILRGDDNIKKFAIRRSFTDEGSCRVASCALYLSRNIDISSSFPDKLKSAFPKEKCIHINSLPKNLIKLLKNKMCNLLKGELLILKSFGITPVSFRPVKFRINKSGNVTMTWQMIITERNNLKRYYKKIGFLLKNKNEKLEEIIKKYDKVDRFNDSVKAVTDLVKNKKIFTHQEFAEKIGVCPERGLFHLRRLILTRKVIKNGWNKYTLNRR